MSLLEMTERGLYCSIGDFYIDPWRAVDQNGVVLDILVQPWRDRFAAIRFFASCCGPQDASRASLLLISSAATGQQNGW